MRIASFTPGRVLAAAVAFAVATPASAAGQHVLHLSRARSDVTLTITGRARPDVAALVDAAQAGCPLEAFTARETTNRVQAALEAADPANLPPGLVLITATPQADNDQCRTTREGVADFAAAAVEFRPRAPQAAIIRVDVVVAEQLVAPSLARTIPTVPLWTRADSAVGAAAQVALPLERFAPVRRLGARPVVLLIWREGETVGERVELSEDDIAALWRLGLPARAAATGGEVTWAQRIGHAAPLAFDELPEAAAVLQQLSVAGDSLGSRTLARQALAVEPCLRLPSDAPMAASGLLDRLRPRAHCRSLGARQVTLRGALVPGLGQVSSRWRTVAGAVVLGVVAQRLVASQASKREGRDYYQRYLEATSIADANEFWARADDARRQTDVLIAQASVVWLGALAEALWYDARLAKRLRFAAPVAAPRSAR